MSKIVKVGKINIGGGAPITIQSMTNTPTSDSVKTLEQINALVNSGCDLVRLAVCDDADIASCKNIIKQISVPLIADIQFDYKMAIACSDIGFSKVRFNPGNIGSENNILQLVQACKANKTAIRVGVNGGSLEKKFLDMYGKTPKAMAESALYNVGLLEKFGFNDIVISVKSSNVKNMISAYRILANSCDYPLHLGVTESGAYEYGLVKSSIGIGSLLADGIGDTIRVSLTGDPVKEVDAAKIILQSLDLREHVEVISCPTCSRCKLDLLSIVDKVNKITANIRKKLKIAVMGCVVNGLGEAGDADLGIAGGDGKAVLFSKGKIIKTIKEEDIVTELTKLIDEMTSA